MTGVRRGMLVGLLVLIVAVAAPLVVRWFSQSPGVGPSIWITLPDGAERRVELAQMQRLPQVSRRGEAQNQYGNWRDGGTYTGVPLADLLGATSYDAIEVVAADGYKMTIERARVTDAAYPMVLAYAFDGVAVPGWADGFRLVVLPDDGSVSNEEYRAVSAGSYWVKNVIRLVVLPASPPQPAGGL